MYVFFHSCLVKVSVGIFLHVMCYDAKSLYLVLQYPKAHTMSMLIFFFKQTNKQTKER